MEPSKFGANGHVRNYISKRKESLGALDTSPFSPLFRPPDRPIYDQHSCGALVEKAGNLYILLSDDTFVYHFFDSFFCVEISSKNHGGIHAARPDQKVFRRTSDLCPRLFILLNFHSSGDSLHAVPSLSHIHPGKCCFHGRERRDRRNWHRL